MRIMRETERNPWHNSEIIILLTEIDYKFGNMHRKKKKYTFIPSAINNLLHQNCILKLILQNFKIIQIKIFKLIF